MPMVEDIATRLHRAKVFTVLNVRNGFWHVSFDDNSSYLTDTIWADECHLGYPRHQKFSNQKWRGGGLTGIEVVADDYIAVGCGETYDDAVQDHHRNLTVFLERCHARNVRVNPEKMKLRQSKVWFIGHVASAKGHQVDPAKIRAITEMPAPSDKARDQASTGFDSRWCRLDLGQFPAESL